MKTTAAILTFVRVGAVAATITAGFATGGCLGDRGKLRVDSPALPFEKPDISEITGIADPDDSDDSGSASGSAAAQPPGK